MKYPQYLALAFASLLSVQAYCSEDTVSCNLEKANAEVQASVLSAPKAFASLGSTAIDTKNVVVGVSQSLSGVNKAGLIRQAADAKCQANAANIKLVHYSLFAENSIQHQGAKAQLDALDSVISKAKNNLNLLQEQLKHNEVTLMDVNAARLTLINLEQKKASLLGVLAVPQGNFSVEKLKDLADQAVEAQAQAAGLIAQAQAKEGWDVVVSAGVRQPLSSSSPTDSQNTQSFIAVTANFSFGYSSAMHNAQSIQHLTADSLRESIDGYSQQLNRQKDKLTKLLEAEQIYLTTTQDEQTKVRQSIHLLDGLTTSLALNSVRNLEIEALELESEIQGCEAKIQRIRELLASF